MEPFDATWLTVTIVLTVPLLLPTLGEVVSERAGVVNIGIEGMMLAGAFGAFLGTAKLHSLTLGIVCGLLAGLIVALPMALLSVQGRADQIVVGIGLNVVVAGITAALDFQFFGESTEAAPPSLSGIAIPGLVDIPGIGEALFDQTALGYLAFLLVPAVWFTLKRTTWGLLVDAAGELPRAVESAGVSVRKVRWIGTLFVGVTAGLGGAAMSIGSTGVFNAGMTEGRGYIALAAVVVGRWNPIGAFAACLLFGAADALQSRLQTFSAIPGQVWLAFVVIAVVLAAVAVREARTTKGDRASSRYAALRPTKSWCGFGIILAVGLWFTIAPPEWSPPAQAWLTFPYVVTLLIVAGLAGRTRAPAALAITYDREGGH